MGLNLIFSSFFDALGQFSDPRFRRVLFIGIALTLALLIGATAGLVYLVDWLIGDSLNVPLVGEITWFDDILSFSSLLLMLVLSVFLMVPVASAITSLFLEDVAQAVEDEHYPRLPEAQGLPFADALRDTINFLGVIVAANLLALLLYVLLPVANILIFWALNGFLLGIFHFGRRPPCWPTARKRIAPRSRRRNLGRRNLNGDAAVYSTAEPGDPDFGGCHLHAPVSPPHSGSSARSKKLRSSSVIQPLMMIPATMAQITKAMPQVIQAFFLRL